MLEDGDVSFEDQPEAINTLGKMCRHLNTIPDSVHIETCQVDPTSEGYNGGFANVYQGVYRGRKVAVKTLRLYITSNFEECFGVSNEDSQVDREVSSHHTVFRNFAERSSPGGTYDIRTFYHLSA